jgi:hypothetical protein
VTFKTFFVKPGYLVFSGALWYAPGILMVVEPHERVDVFVCRNGKPAACVGSYGYDRLDMRAPPPGLRSARQPLTVEAEDLPRQRVAA